MTRGNENAVVVAINRKPIKNISTILYWFYPLSHCCSHHWAAPRVTYESTRSVLQSSEADLSCQRIPPPPSIHVCSGPMSYLTSSIRGLPVYWSEPPSASCCWSSSSWRVFILLVSLTSCQRGIGPFRKPSCAHECGCSLQINEKQKKEWTANKNYKIFWKAFVWLVRYLKGQHSHDLYLTKCNHRVDFQTFCFLLELISMTTQGS